MSASALRLAWYLPRMSLSRDTTQEQMYVSSEYAEVLLNIRDFVYRKNRGGSNQLSAELYMKWEIG